MKLRIVKFLFLMLLTGILFAAPVSAIPMVSLELIGSTTVTEGSTFTVDVCADGDDIDLDLLAFGFDVLIDDESIVGYTAYAVASGFDDDSGFTDVAGSAFEGIETDDVLLATLSFTALAEGTTIISVSGIYDEIFSGLYYEMPDWSWDGYDIRDSITITVATGAQPVPEPATLFLFGVGLIGIGSVKKYKKT